jgi:hypothetical protein
MNDFVAAAEAAAGESTPISGAALINRFLDGKNGSAGEFHAIDRNLYHKEKVVARLCPNGAVLTGESNLPDTAINDAFVGTVYSRGRPLRRVKSFANLASAKDRLAELDSGDAESFSNIAGLFGFEYTAFELDALQRAKDFRTRVSEYFTKIEEEEKARVKSAEDAARRERLEGQMIAWDSGTGPARNTNVRGAGGGQRIRVAANPHRSGGRSYPAVETSTGQRTTVAQVQRAWNHCTKYWHGGKPLGGGYYAGRTTIAGGRSITAKSDGVDFGCQTVTRKEAERFADVMGWNRATPPTEA